MSAPKNASRRLPLRMQQEDGHQECLAVELISAHHLDGNRMYPMPKVGGCPRLSFLEHPETFFFRFIKAHRPPPTAQTRSRSHSSQRSVFRFSARQTSRCSCMRPHLAPRRLNVTVFPREGSRSRQLSHHRRHLTSSPRDDDVGCEQPESVSVSRHCRMRLGAS